MSYNSKELRLLVPRLTADGVNIWTYDDTATIATVIAAGYISDAKKQKDSGRGMNVGDIVLYRRFSSLSPKTTLTSLSVLAVSAVADAGATMIATADADA